MLNEGLNTGGMTAFVVLGIVAGFAVVGLIRAILNNKKK